MVARSMTGYGEVSRLTEFGVIVAEIRSSNNRFLDITIKLPEQLKKFENKLREIVSMHASRGKIEVRLSLQPTRNDGSGLKLNKLKVDELIDLQNEVLASCENLEKLGVSDVLKWPGVIQDSFLSENIDQQKLTEICESVSKEFQNFTEREGLQLIKQIISCADEIDTLIQKAEKIAPLAAEAMVTKISTRLSDALKEINLKKPVSAMGNQTSERSNQNGDNEFIVAIHERIRLEASMSAIKVDVSEELERIKSHMVELRNVLSNDNVLKGKRLDFLSQELHREANTLGSKSFNQDLNMISLDLRVCIEQIREQVQNLQ